MFILLRRENARISKANNGGVKEMVDYAEMIFAHDEEGMKSKTQNPFRRTSHDNEKLNIVIKTIRQEE